MMTMLSTVIGVPLILGGGAAPSSGCDWLGCLRGVGHCNSFTLILIPVIYSLLAPLAKPRAHAGVRLDRAGNSERQNRKGGAYGVRISCNKIDEVGVAVHAENLGYDFCWMTDSPMIRSNVWAVMALAAQQTQRLRLGTGVAVRDYASRRSLQME